MKHLPKINFEPINHNKHRYETVGDYFPKGKEWFFKVSKMNSKYEFLVLIHELTEWFLTQQRGIKEKDITKFDEKFEKERSLGLHTDEEEPGFADDCPYRNEHAFATKIEKILADELEVNWKEYDNAVMSL